MFLGALHTSVFATKCRVVSVSVASVSFVPNTSSAILGVVRQAGDQNTITILANGSHTVLCSNRAVSYARAKALMGEPVFFCILCCVLTAGIAYHCDLPH